jgi:hypothetical protein
VSPGPGGIPGGAQNPEVAGVQAATTQQVAATAAQASSEVLGASAAAPDAEEVAGVQAAALPALASTAGAVIAGMLPATGQPVALFGIGMLGLAGIGLFMRRIGRKPR